MTITRMQQIFICGCDDPDISEENGIQDIVYLDLMNYINPHSSNNSNASELEQNQIDYLYDNMEEIMNFTESHIFIDDKIMAIIYTFIFIIGVWANIIVLIVIGLDTQLRTKSSLLYAFNLALADCMMLLFLPMNIYRTLQKDWIFGKVACALNNSVLYVNMFVSIFMLMLMALDRYLAVIRNSFIHRFSKYRNSPVVIGHTCFFVWFFAFLAALPNYLRSEHVSHGGKHECGINWHENRSIKEEADICGEKSKINGSHIVTGWRCRCGMTDSEKQYNFHLFGWTFLLPLISIVFSYVNIGYVIWKSSKRTRDMSLKRSDSRRSTNERTRKLMILIVALIMMYVICWTPFHLFHLLVSFGVEISQTPCTVYEHTYNALIWFNSAINPILYSFLGHGFKVKLYEVWKRLKRMLPCHLRLIPLSQQHKLGPNLLNYSLPVSRSAPSTHSTELPDVTMQDKSDLMHLNSATTK